MDSHAPAKIVGGVRHPGGARPPRTSNSDEAHDGHAANAAPEVDAGGNELVDAHEKQHLKHERKHSQDQQKSHEPSKQKAHTHQINQPINQPR